MKCGLIGEHLGHSFSPMIHGELADYSYDLFELSPDEVGSFVRDGDLDAFTKEQIAEMEAICKKRKAEIDELMALSKVVCK